jgi:hypothetical protein
LLDNKLYDGLLEGFKKASSKTVYVSVSSWTEPDVFYVQMETCYPRGLTRPEDLPTVDVNGRQRRVIASSLDLLPIGPAKGSFAVVLRGKYCGRVVARAAPEDASNPDKCRVDLVGGAYNTKNLERDVKDLAACTYSQNPPANRKK